MVLKEKRDGNMEAERESNSGPPWSRLTKNSDHLHSFNRQTSNAKDTLSRVMRKKGNRDFE
jgi:hypothetical protein